MVSLKRYPDTNLHAELLRFLSRSERPNDTSHASLATNHRMASLRAVFDHPRLLAMIHPFAERWRARHRSYRRSPYTVLLPAWMAMWVVVALVARPWRDALLYRADWLWGVSALLLVCGLYLYSQSGKSFSAKQLGGLPEIHGGNRDQQLVTDGIRARMRHPVYLAHLCEMLAWSVGTGLAVCWGLTAFAVVTGVVMIRLEDAELEERFGNSYRAYRRSVPAILPRVWEARQL